MAAPPIAMPANPCHNVPMDGNRIIAADIGGTHSRFALFEGTPLRQTAIGIVPSALADFDAVLAEARQTCPAVFERRADACVLAVAAPVTSQDELPMVNQPWSIRRVQLAPYAADVRFINDFEAQARACAMPVMDAAERILAGDCAPDEGQGTSPTIPADLLEQGLCVIGAGTGLGVAFCRRMREGQGAGQGGALDIMASEAGHTPFPLHGGAEQDYAAFLRDATGRDAVEYEDILSGRGLALLHGFLTGERLAAADITARSGFAASDTCRWFARMYGRACRIMVLTTMSRGVVITGGVAGRCPALVTNGAFREEFLAIRAPFGDIVASVPVWLNRTQDAGLWGAAQAALEGLVQA